MHVDNYLFKLTLLKTYAEKIIVIQITNKKHVQNIYL